MIDRLYFMMKVFAIKIIMVKNLFVGLFTHKYPVKLFIPPYWSDEEYLKYIEVRKKLEEIYNSNPDTDGTAKDYFSELQNLPVGAIVTAYNRVIMRVPGGWAKL